MPYQESPAARRSKKYVSTYIKVIVGIVIFAAGVYAGAVGNVGGIQERVVQRELTNLDALSDGLKEQVDAELFWTVWNLVQQKYAGGKQTDVDLFYGAIEGVVASLDDPYSIFLEPEITQQFVDDLSGSFEGIGAEISKRDGRLVIVAPLAGSPAEAGGLLAGDVIATIDGEDASPLPLDEAVRRIRGKRGTDVVFEIYREDAEDLIDITITRAPIELVTVAMEEWDNGVVYAQLAHFNEQTLDKMEPVIKAALDDGATGLILDLRNNPGGFLDVAVDLSSEWLAAGDVVVKEDFSNGKDDLVYTSTGKHRLADVPTMVLVNGGSASASEILAGALQDHQKATIIGQQTFGKGSVQEFQTFSDGSSLKLTVAKWLTPNGRSIDEEGVIPDEIVEDLGPGEDLAVEKALELLLK